MSGDSNTPKKGSSIFDRLTDPKSYTGSHKQRFDSDGKGRGLAGRDMLNGDRVSDISQIVRADNRAPKKSSSPSKQYGSVSSPKPITPKSDGSGQSNFDQESSPTRKPEKDIVDRLTNPKNFTGSHKNRFDLESGKGKGLEGRDMGNENLKSLEQLTRSSLHKSAPLDPSQRKPIKFTVTKFGTQAEKAKTITLYQNGDKYHGGLKITLGKLFNTWDKMLKHASEKLTLTTPCKKIYLVNGPDSFTKVTSLTEMIDGGCYLACGGEKIIKDELPNILLEKARKGELTPRASANTPKSQQ